MGHIIRTKCCCGYEVELMSGDGESGIRYGMAYSKQGYEIETFELPYIETYGLVRIIDPFDYEELDGWGQFVKVGHQGELFLSDEEKRLDLIPCPRCKMRSLYLTWAGIWD